MLLGTQLRRGRRNSSPCAPPPPQCTHMNTPIHMYTYIQAHTYENTQLPLETYRKP